MFVPLLYAVCCMLYVIILLALIQFISFKIISQKKKIIFSNSFIHDFITKKKTDFSFSLFFNVQILCHSHLDLQMNTYLKYEIELNFWGTFFKYKKYGYENKKNKKRFFWLLVMVSHTIFMGINSPFFYKRSKRSKSVFYCFDNFY